MLHTSLRSPHSQTGNRRATFKKHLSAFRAPVVVLRNNATAIIAGPSCFLHRHEFVDPKVLDYRKISSQIHAVLLHVVFLQTLYARTRISAAFVAIRQTFTGRAGLPAALQAMLGLLRAIGSAARTGILSPQAGIAIEAVNTAGRQIGRWYTIRHFHNLCVPPSHIFDNFVQGISHKAYSTSVFLR